MVGSAKGREYVLEQDSAPAHKARITQAWLYDHVPHHWSPELWFPSSQTVTLLTTTRGASWKGRQCSVIIVTKMHENYPIIVSTLILNMISIGLVRSSPLKLREAGIRYYPEELHKIQPPTRFVEVQVRDNSLSSENSERKILLPEIPYFDGNQRDRLNFQHFARSGFRQPAFHSQLSNDGDPPHLNLEVLNSRYEYKPKHETWSNLSSVIGIKLKEMQNGNNEDFLKSLEPSHGDVSYKIDLPLASSSRPYISLDKGFETLLEDNPVTETVKEVPEHIQNDIHKSTLISSLVRMITTVNGLKNKRPDTQAVNAAHDDVTDQKEPAEETAEVQINRTPDWRLPKVGPWDPTTTPVATAVLGSTMLFLIIVVVVFAIQVHCKNRRKRVDEWIRHPVVQPPTPASDTVQPHLQISSPEHYFNGEPIRIKAKGLLERRGSNTSLTIQLGESSESSEIASPSRECTPEDFLLSAGNRMNRKQLQSCLKDTRILHKEFWDIPTNYPERCIIPGASCKNRYRTVLPNEATRIKLNIEKASHPSETYINANYIRGYDNDERAFIATQGPLAHTVEDFWTLVLQEKVPVIVMITRLKEKGRVKCEPYIPSYSGKYGTIRITVKQVVQKNGYTIRQINVERGKEIHCTLHFWYTSWPDHKTPTSARNLLSMAAEVQNSREEGSGPVIVHCSAGIGRTGCFIAISIAMLQLMEEHCVDILSIVCQMRIDRGGMVQTAEQYEFIHRALIMYEASLPPTPGD